MSNSPVSRIGDVGTHGGVITSGSSNWQCSASPIARVGDNYACPLHGDNPIVTGSSTWSCNSRPIARVGSVTGCGAVITSGSSNWQVD